MDFSRLTTLAGGYLEARLIQVAMSLGLFDAIGTEPWKPTSLAAALGTDPKATELLLNALVAMELLDKSAGAYSLNQVSATYLLRTSPSYYGDMILFDSMLWRSWGNLEAAIRSGQAVRPPDMYQNDPHETERFIRAMDSLVKARGDTRVLSFFCIMFHVS